jgi:hypothetical protein
VGYSNSFPVLLCTSENVKLITDEAAVISIAQEYVLLDFVAEEIRRVVVWPEKNRTHPRYTDFGHESMCGNISSIHG